MRTAVVYTEVNGVTHAGCETCSRKDHGTTRWRIQGPYMAVQNWVDRHNRNAHKEVA